MDDNEYSVTKAPSSNIPLNMDFDFVPNTPYSIDPQDHEGFGASTNETGTETKPSALRTVAAEAYDFNTIAQLTHAGYSKLNEPNPLDDTPPSGWKPTSDPSMFYDINPEYMSTLMAARGPKEMQNIRDRILSEQAHDDALANGETFDKIIGGFAGALTDPVSWIPIAGWAKYAKLAPTIFKTAAKTFPGIAASSVIQSGARQIDRVNGNLNDFVIDAGINTLFGTALFAGIGAGGLALEKMELWNLRSVTKGNVEGVDFLHEVNDKGVITGIKATNPNGNLSAAEVYKYQEIANSAFLKSGLFKIPFIGEGLLKLKGAPVIGSPLIAMQNSEYPEVQAFISYAADQQFITKGIEAGAERPKSFEYFMKREFADLRGIAAQMNALHLERMGFDIKNRPLGDITRVGTSLYNTSLKALGQDVSKHGFVSREDFNDEVQRVLFSEESSEHAPVNTAAAIFRKKMDSTFKAWKEANNFSEDIINPRTAAGYLMRVYDTPYLNNNKKKWMEVIPQYLAESDELIKSRMAPIESLAANIKDFETKHTQAVKILGNLKAKRIGKAKGAPITGIEHGQTERTNELIPGTPEHTLKGMRARLRAMKEDLQNELRTNPDYNLHIHDIHALSANEAKELKQLLKPQVNLEKQIAGQKEIVSKVKADRSRKLSVAKNQSTIEKAIPKSEKYVDVNNKVKAEEDKLFELESKLEDVQIELQQKAHNKQINPALYTQEPNSFQYNFKNPNNRLRFRDVYESHFHREAHAKAYYDSIMHMNPEDIIADVMGKVTGNARENSLKSRSLLVPDKLLYDNNFMTKDIMSKLNNYVLYLSRRTHIKNVFKDITPDGGIENIIGNIAKRYDSKKDEITNSGKSKSAIDKALNKEKAKFEVAKKQISLSHERMMGLRKRENWEVATQGVVRSLTAMINLHYLPATQIADTGAIGLQAGVMPFIREGVAPILSSLNGWLKSPNTEAVREVLPSFHLGLNDILNGHADKNIAMETQPYLNLGPVVGGVEKLAHFSGNADLTNYIENFNQKLAGSVYQGELMRLLIKHQKGELSKNNKEFLLKYGINPEKWGERMVKAYKEAGGIKTALGGHQSMYWKWQDLEAANEFSAAVFRGIENTVIRRGLFDSPFWADNMMGMIFHTFTGWGYASINRYVIPLLQRPDAEKLLGVMMSLSFGSLVSPIRRMARGEDAYPEDQTPGQKFYETVNDSSVSSALANVLSWANFLSNDSLLGELKNDKFKQRVKVGSGSVVEGTANRLGSVIDALASGQWNEKDAKQLARMLPITGTVYGSYLSNLLIENMGLPLTRQAAEAQNS